MARKDIAKAKAKAATLPILSSDEATSGTAILEFQSPALTLITAPAPLSARLTNLMLASLVIATFVIFATLPVDRIVSTTGVLLSQTPNVIVQPFENAIVRRILVSEGQTVKKGDVLAELDPTFAASDEKSTIAQRSSLRAQVDRLRAELADRPYLSDGSQYGQLEEMAYLQRHQQFINTMADYDARIKSLEAKVETAKSDIEGFTRRLAGLKSVEDIRKDLERLQVGSKLDTLLAQDQRFQIQQSLDDARHALDGSQKDLASMIAQRDAWKHQWYSDTQSQESQQERLLSDMSGQAEKNTLRHDLVQMKAESDSVVLSVSRVSPGTVMTVGEQLMTTVPVDSPLEVVAVVDGADSGFVQVGDQAAIKFDTLPYYRYGLAIGHVTRISSDSFTDATLGQSGSPSNSAAISTQSPQNLGTAPVYFYRVYVTIDRYELRHPPASFREMPGMPLVVDVKVGERTILQYMLDKVAPFLTEGLREPT